MATVIKHRKKLPKFVLAKGSSATEFASYKKQYRKNIEKALIVTLLAIMLLFRLATGLEIKKYLVANNELNLELIDILNIPPIEEPPPQLQMENVVEVIPEPEEIDSEEAVNVKEIMDQIEEMLSENDGEAELALASNDMNNYLLSNSPMGSVAGSGLNFRKDRTIKGGDLRLDRGGGLTEGLSSGDLDIGSAKTKRREIASANSGLELKSKKQKKDFNRTREDKKPSSLDLNAGTGKILSFASASIGAEDYKLWNKIISELDRLNKGRYGSVNDAIKRNRSGFVIRFAYNDGSVQEINWRRDGNVWIRILGGSSRTTNQELRQALTRLLRLSL